MFSVPRKFPNSEKSVEQTKSQTKHRNQINCFGEWALETCVCSLLMVGSMSVWLEEGAEGSSTAQSSSVSVSISKALQKSKLSNFSEFQTNDNKTFQSCQPKQTMFVLFFCCTVLFYHSGSPEIIFDVFKTCFECPLTLTPINSMTHHKVLAVCVFTNFSTCKHNISPLQILKDSGLNLNQTLSFEQIELWQLGETFLWLNHSRAVFLLKRSSGWQEKAADANGKRAHLDGIKIFVYFL